jgi:hypothetical protein
MEPKTSEPPTPLRWAGRTIATGVGVVVVVLLVGGSLGVLDPMEGMAGGALVMFIGGGVWASRRLSTSAFVLFGAVMLDVAAAIGAAVEARKAWVATMSAIAEHGSIVEWSPDSGERLVHVRPLTYLAEASATVSGRFASGVSNLGVERHGRYKKSAIALVESDGGPVVAFDCYAPNEYRGDGGGWVVSLRAREFVAEDECAAAIEAVRARLDETKRPVAPGAEDRLVRAFETERDLRHAHELETALEVPLKALVLFSVLALLFCERGAAPEAKAKPRK